MSRSGKIVLNPSGRRGILKNGKTVLFNGKEDCPSCCADSYFFTVHAPADAVDSDGGLVAKPHEEVMSLLRRNGRKYGRISAGKYSILYCSGRVMHGCGRYNCSHYINYYVSTLGVLPGFTGPWQGAPGPPEYEGNADNAKVLQDLDTLKNEEFIYTQSEDDDFKVGFWPWYEAAYSSGFMTYCLRPITGRIADWTGPRGRFCKEPPGQSPSSGPVPLAMSMRTSCSTTGAEERDFNGKTVTAEPSLLDRGRNRCRWMIDTGIDAGGACSCRLVECDRPESPLYRGLNPDKPFRWKSRHCNPNNCRFFSKSPVIER